MNQTNRKMARKVCVASLFRLCTYIHALAMFQFLMYVSALEHIMHDTFCSPQILALLNLGSLH